MIKVFLVEDEKIIRKSIKNNVKWEENGFEFAGEAPDGEMALPMIEKLHPDIVITDIKMPFMDGLELSDILKKKMPEIQIIILSGYGEFDYAKEAIKIGVTEGYVLMIKAQNTEETIQVAKDYVAALTKRMKKEKELQWFAGIGHAVERLHNLSESYDSASKAFAYQYQSSGNEAVFFDKLDNEKIERAEDLQQVDFTKVNSESLEEFLKNGKEEAVHLFVEDYTKTLGKSNMDSFMFCQYMLINIQVGVMKFVEKMGVEKANIDRTFKDYKQQIAAVSTGEKAAEYIEELIIQAIRMRNERLGKKHSSLITEAKEFIVKNYQEETLSLSDVADQVGLSSSHFSTTFKQETGKSFVEFLTSVRMDKAKEMLCFTDMKASQISYEVGYKDPHYFSYLFKKTQGCTPSEYRSRRM